MKIKNILRKHLIKRFAKTSDSLFDGDDVMFKEIVGKCQIYAEYGCGASTLWVSSNTACSIYSVDTSSDWIERVQLDCIRTDNIHLHHTQVGDLGNWGRPLSYDFCENFSDYSNWFWNMGISPDAVLIDGRFRVCCFLTTLLRAKEGASIIFDDYTNRRHYHYVERFLKPAATCGRQALFTVPSAEKLNKEEIEKAAQKFSYVFD
jgi:hypothetical protein